MEINFNRDVWGKIFSQFYLTGVAPTTEEEWSSFFQNAVASEDPLQYDNIRQSLIVELYKDDITPNEVRLLCEKLETLLDLSKNNRDKLEKVYASYVDNFQYILKKRKGINIIRIKDGHEPFWFATNSVVRYLLFSK